MAKDLFRVLLTLLFMMSTSAHAFDLIKEARQKGWLDRLFYVGGKSLVRSGAFFVSQKGRRDPLAELEITVDLLQSGETQKIAQFACMFPGRYSYLTPKLGIESKTFFCDKFESWRDSFEADGLSLMFASQYLENPASSFGHTYLKVNSRKKSLYLNKVISFAATVPEDVGAGEYVWKGLTGGFQGAFNVSPFYILFQEYANMEKRDIWEYELDISAKETESLLANLYEIIHHAKFDYMFLSENCSSLLLRLLDIHSRKDLLRSLPVYVIPIETVKVLKETGAIKKSFFHPSITSRMTIQAKAMRPQEIKDFVRYVDQDEKLTQAASPASLDLGLEYLNFQRHKLGGILPLEKKKDFDHYLIFRSRHSSESLPLAVKALDPNKASHPQRFSIGAHGINQDPVGLALAYRPLGKDFLDRPNGYAKESEINLLKTKLFLSADESKDSWFNLDVLGIRKYSDYNPITKNISWGANLSVKSLVAQGCLKCYFAEIDSALGLGEIFFKDSFLTYLLVHPTLRVGNVEHQGSFLPQVELGLIQSHEDYVLKNSLFNGIIYDGHNQRSFVNLKNSFSWIYSNDLSLNFSHEHFLQKHAWNSWEMTFSFYY